jgi:hypothetical protein
MTVSLARVLPSQDWKVCQHCLSMRDSAAQHCDKSVSRLWRAGYIPVLVLYSLVTDLGTENPSVYARVGRLCSFFGLHCFDHHE